jgi:hypothetical protein
MSTIVTSNVSDGTLSIPTTYVTNGSAKAWVNFVGTGTIAVRDSFNVASLTDNGTGDYTVNFSSAFGAADYATPASARRDAGGGAMVQKRTAGTASAVRVVAVGDGGSDIDVDEVSIATHGDLA